MTEQEVRRYLRQMKEEDSERALLFTVSTICATTACSVLPAIS